MAAGGKDVLMKRGLLGLTLLLALLPLACGGGEALSPEAAVAEAATNSQEAGSSRVSLELTMTGIAAEPLTITGEGIQDPEQQLASFTMDLSEVGALTGGGVDLGEIEIILDGTTLYMRLPFLEGADLKPWIEIDIEAIAEQEGLDLPSLQQLGQADPALTFAYLRAASRDTEEVGEEDVRGVETTHYRMTVELAKVAEQVPEEQREEMRAAIQALIEATGLDTVPVEAWIDGDGLIRRMDLGYEDVEVGPGKKGDMSMSMELYDYGVAVDVGPPPSDQVMSFEELLQLGGEAG
jgi:hypothetical protein